MIDVVRPDVRGLGPLQGSHRPSRGAVMIAISVELSRFGVPYSEPRTEREYRTTAYVT